MAHTNKNADGKQTNMDTVAFFLKWNTNINSCRSLDYARGNESIIYFTDLYKPIETYIYARKKRPFASYPAAMHPKHSKFAITDIREKPANFFIVRHGRRP